MEGGGVMLEMRAHSLVLLLICAVGVVALALALPVGVHAQGRYGGGGILVSPARLVATVQPRELLPPIQVKNTTQEAVEIVAYVGRGEHRWDGSPIYLDSPEERIWGAKHLELDRPHLELAPGESGSIIPRVGDLHGVVGGFYPVIFLEMKSVGQSSGISAISRLAVITLLQVAGGGSGDLTVATLNIEQAHPGEAIGVFPLVTNHGNTHATFSGYIEIAHSEENVTTQLPVAPMTVLPGLGRQLALWWQPDKLPVGTYEVKTHLASGGRAVEADEWAFRVVQPYALATLQGDVVSWSPERTAADSSTAFRAVVHNTGTITWRALGDLEVRDMTGILRAQVPVELDEVEPGGSGSITGVLPALAPGRYTLRMSLVSDGAPLLDMEQVLDVMGGGAVAQL